jgi:hypothetical protein
MKNLVTGSPGFFIFTPYGKEKSPDSVYGNTRFCGGFVAGNSG